MPKRIQRKRTKGWRMPKNAVYVGRPTRFGNFFKVGDDATDFSFSVPFHRPTNLDEVVANYRYYANLELKFNPYWLEQLKGKDLVCWCALDKPCHADVLLELANEGRDY